MERVFALRDFLVRITAFMEDETVGRALCLHKGMVPCIGTCVLQRRKDAKVERILFTVFLEFSIIFQISVPIRRYARRNEPAFDDLSILCNAVRQAYDRRCARYFLPCTFDENWQRHQQSERVRIILAEMLTSYRRFCVFCGNANLCTRIQEMVLSSNIALSESAVNGVLEEIEQFPLHDMP